MQTSTVLRALLVLAAPAAPLLTLSAAAQSPLDAPRGSALSSGSGAVHAVTAGQPAASALEVSAGLATSGARASVSALPPSWQASGDGAFGSALVGLDFNGDGIGDLAVGAPLATSAHANEGRVTLYLGTPTGLSTSPLWTIFGGSAGARFGAALANAGDINGDGLDDLVVGAPGTTVTAQGEGAVRVYFGRSASTAPATPSWQIASGQASAALGSAVAGGDVNGDGRADVLVAAPNYDRASTDDGLVSLFLSTGTALATTAHWSQWGGTQSGMHLGTSLAIADVNSDRMGDIFVGAPDYDASGLVDAGLLGYFAGHPTLVSSSATGVRAGDQAGGRLGTAMARTFNFDGGMRDHVVVGAPGYRVNHAGEGIATVFGTATSPLGLVYTIFGGGAGVHAGISLAGATGYTADGLGAFVMGLEMPSGDGGYAVVSGNEERRVAGLFFGTAGERLGTAVGAVHPAVRGGGTLVLGASPTSGRVEGYVGGAPSGGVARVRLLHNISLLPVPVRVRMDVDADANGSYETMAADVTIAYQGTQTGTPYVENVPTGVPFQLRISAPSLGAFEVTRTFPSTLFEAGRTYRVAATSRPGASTSPACIDVSGHAVCLAFAPDVTAATVAVAGGASPAAADAVVDVAFWHGISDAGPLSFREGSQMLAENVALGAPAAFVAMSDGVHRVEILDAATGALLRAITFDLAGKAGQPVDILVGGYLRPDQFPNPFGLPSPPVRAALVERTGAGTPTAAPREATLAAGALAVRGLWPNPAGASATVSLALGAASEVQVEVFDVLGRRVLATAPSVLAAGDAQRVGLDLGALAPGTYAVRVTATGEGRTATQTTPLVRRP